MRRLAYWFEKFTSANWQHGHPDEWSDAEMFYYLRTRR